MKKLLNTNGSIALITTLIISAVIVFVVVTMSDIAITGSYKSFNHEASKITFYAADSCLEETLIRLERDPAFTSGNITIDSDTDCNITVSGTTISVTVNYLDFTESYQGSYTISSNGLANNADLTSWSEQ